MSEWHNRPDGDEDCEFGNFHELVLTHKIMEVITRFSRDERIEPGPYVLRDTMLAVSALLHLEGEKVAATRMGHPIDCKLANRAFTQAARERFDAVLEADAIRRTWRKH